MIARAKRHKQATRTSLRAWLDEQKSQPCLDCGVQYPPYVMQFDHVRGEKKFNIGDAVNRPLSRARIAEEIEKCEIVCANCHMIRTHD